MNAPIVVLDTNIVLSALLFGSGALGWLRPAWQGGLFIPLICKETATELIRVLAYPKFKLTANDREELLADYLPWCQTGETGDTNTFVPGCRDPFDIPFLKLALAAKADALVTGNGDLLILKPQFPRLILTAGEFARQLHGTGNGK